MKVQKLKKAITKEGRRILLYRSKFAPFSRLLKKTPKILIIGATHGDEPQGEYFINKIIKEFPQPKNDIFFIPCHNPDGLAKNTRGNANGVDINRNFPTKNWNLSTDKDDYYSGKSPASEIETRFLIRVMERYKPDLVFTIHAPYQVVNYDGSAKKIAQKISELNGYPVQDDIGYETPGSFGTWAGVERNIPIITLELPASLDCEKLFKENKKVFDYLLGEYI